MNYIFKSKSVRYGVKMFLAIGIFFLILYALGLGDVAELRYFNLLFVIYFSNKLAKTNATEPKDKSYIKNLSSVFGANLINVLLCIGGLLLFNVIFEPEFLSHVTKGVLIVETTSVPQVIISLFIEGVAGTAVVSFVLLQYWKNHRATYTPYKEWESQ